MKKEDNLFDLSNELKNKLLICDLNYQTPLSYDFHHYESLETLKHLREQQLFDLVFGNYEKERI